LDTETSGFPRDGGSNEPVQIVALLYKNGLDSKKGTYKEYFIPNGEITQSALDTHGLSKDILKKNGAREFSLG